VFSTATGQPFSHGQVSRAMTKVRELAAARGVSPDRTFHSSRHTFVSLAIQAKQDDEWLRNQIGHHSSAYTRSVYSHMLEQADDMSFVDFGAPAEPATSGYKPATAATKSEGAGEAEARNTSEGNEKLVTQAGFEPATPSFGGWCSIQLSYWATRTGGPLSRVVVGRTGLEPVTSAV
jgi:hypothetical protein